MEIIKKMDNNPLTIKIKEDKQHIILKIVYIKPIISGNLSKAFKCLLWNVTI